MSNVETLPQNYFTKEILKIKISSPDKIVMI